MADHWEYALSWPAAMNVAVPPAHWPQRRSEVRADGIEDRFTESQPCGCVPNQRCENVALSQRQPYGGAQGFLAPPQEDPAKNFPHAPQTGELVVQKPGQNHNPVRLDIRVSC